jgi:hemolysin activation/secretion protein
MRFLKTIVAVCSIAIGINSPAIAQILPRQPEKPIEVPMPQDRPKIPLVLPANPKLPNARFPPLRVKKFLYLGNTVVKDSELDNLIRPYLDKQISQDDLDKITDTITQYYVQKGYVTSGATIVYGDNPSFDPESATIKIRIIEGRLGKISVAGSKRLDRYIQQGIAISKPLNTNKLLEDLNRLNSDELIDSLGARLLPNPDSLVNRNNLEISVKPRKVIDLSTFVNNSRNVTVGTYEGGVNFVLRNATGRGDRFSTLYSRASAGNLLVSNYTLPIDRWTSLDFGYAWASSTNIASPFDVLNIKGTSQAFDFGVSRILVSDYSDGKSELKVKLGLHHQETQEEVLGLNFPVSQGASENGNTFTSSITLALEYERIRSQEAYFLQSKFNFGVDFGSETDPFFHNGQYFWWDADAIYSHKLPLGLLFVSRLSTQLSDSPLVGADIFSLGGASTIRGFRPDTALGENGFHGSLDVKIPAYKGKVGEFYISPFFDIGYVWSDPRISDNSTLLASTGLSLEYYFAKKLSVIFSWGHPLFGNRQNLQDSGFLFSIKWDLL